jgi:hypothetical protein
MVTTQFLIVAAALAALFALYVGIFRLVERRRRTSANTARRARHLKEQMDWDRTLAERDDLAPMARRESSSGSH